jgi:hypothetical protein
MRQIFCFLCLLTFGVPQGTAMKKKSPTAQYTNKPFTVPKTVIQRRDRDTDSEPAESSVTSSRGRQVKVSKRYAEAIAAGTTLSPPAGVKRAAESLLDVDEDGVRRRAYRCRYAFR